MYKNAFKFAAAALLLGTTLFATSCGEEKVIKEKPALKGAGFILQQLTQKEWDTPVTTASATRASALSEIQPRLTFAEGDMLYVQGFQFDENHNPIATCVGNLTMDDVAGNNEATFSGDLFAPENTSLDDFQDVVYYLVGANDKRAKLSNYQDTGIKIIDGDLGKNYIVSSFKEAIEKYSEIGFEAPAFGNEVQLKQHNIYFVFNLTFPVLDIDLDEIAGIEAHFLRHAPTHITVTTEENPQGFELDKSGNVKVVVPCDLEEEDEYISNIVLKVSFKNGVTFNLEFPSKTTMGNLVKEGELYVINAKVKNRLTSKSKVGDVGELDGRTGMIVDLGGEYGKVAIDLLNVGADDYSSMTSTGGYYQYYESNINEWCIMPVAAYKALFDKYGQTVDFEMHGDGYPVAAFTIKEGRYPLYFPMVGYKNENGEIQDRLFGFYCSLLYGRINSVDPYYILMGIGEGKTLIAEYYPCPDNDTDKRSLRHFHLLPD